MRKGEKDSPSPNSARELARINLPLSLFTEWYWQIDLHNLMHFLRLRMDPHAQKEIRAYGRVMASIAAAVCPDAMEAFDEFVLNAETFSKSDQQALRNVIDGKPAGLEGKEYDRFARKLRIGREPE